LQLSVKAIRVKASLLLIETNMMRKRKVKKMRKSLKRMNNQVLNLRKMNPTSTVK
jgi:hypothetical protein